MALSHSPSIVTDGLVFCADVLNPRSVRGSSLLDLTTTGIVNGTLGTIVDSTAGNTMDLTAGTELYVDFNPTVNHESWSLMFFARSNTSPPASSYRSILELRETTYSTYFYDIDIRETTNSYVLGYQKDESISSWLSHGFGTNQALWLAGNWHCFVTTHSNKVFKTYRNGSLIQTQTQTLNVDTYGNIDRLRINVNQPIPILLGPVLFYNAVLTDEQVTQNFNALRGRFGL